MDAYYVMIHFDGPYVTGFIVPQANDPVHAISLLKKELGKHLVKIRGTQSSGLDDSTESHTRAFLRSLKHPWRAIGAPRHNGEKKAFEIRYNPGEMVRVQKLDQTTYAGYWLKSIGTTKNLCNTHHKDEFSFATKT